MYVPSHSAVMTCRPQQARANDFFHTVQTKSKLNCNSFCNLSESEVLRFLFHNKVSKLGISLVMQQLLLELCIQHESKENNGIRECAWLTLAHVFILEKNMRELGRVSKCPLSLQTACNVGNTVEDISIV